jgi:predicted Zn-dependent protease
MMFSFWRSGKLAAVLLVFFLVFSVPVLAHDGLHEQIIAVTKKIRKNPKDAALYIKRAELYRLHAELRNAEADFLRAERLAGSEPAIDLGRGRLWLDAKQYSKARTALDKYLSKQPDGFEGVLTMARALAKLKDTEGSNRYFTRAISLAPQDSTEIYFERSEMLAAAGKVDEALKGLDEGITKLGPIVTLQMAAIDLELKLGRYERAVERLDKLAETMPRKESLLLRRGEILLQAGKPCEARASLIASQNGFDSLPPARKNVRAVRTNLTQLRALLSRPAVRDCRTS